MAIRRTRATQQCQQCLFCLRKSKPSIGSTCIAGIEGIVPALRSFSLETHSMNSCKLQEKAGGK